MCRSAQWWSTFLIAEVTFKSYSKGRHRCHHSIVLPSNCITTSHFESEMLNYSFWGLGPGGRPSLVLRVFLRSWPTVLSFIFGEALAIDFPFPFLSLPFHLFLPSFPPLFFGLPVSHSLSSLPSFLRAGLRNVRIGSAKQGLPHFRGPTRLPKKLRRQCCLLVSQNTLVKSMHSLLYTHVSDVQAWEHFLVFTAGRPHNFSEHGPRIC